MLILSQTTDLIEIVLGGSVTTRQLDVVSNWRDITTSAYTPGRTTANTNNTTDVTIVGSPAASTQRVVDTINVYNDDTVSAVVTVKFSDNGTEYILWSGTLTSRQTLTYQEGNGWSVSSGSLGYTLFFQALTSSPTDAQTIYFGNLPKAPVTTADTSKVYIPTAGNIVRAEIYCYSGTAGTAENWSGYIRLNNATDTLIATVGAATNERVFRNSSLAIAVSEGDRIEMKFINPTWVTNPLTTIFGGYIYIR